MGGDETRDVAVDVETSGGGPDVETKPAAPAKPRRGRRVAPARRPRPAVRRAGGYVDYGDGRGWVLDDRKG